jgi:hypothetical protein
MALGLAMFDGAFAIVASARPGLAARIIGAETGFYADWGVGQLLGYALIQASAAVAPSRSRFAAVAGLRAAAIPADLLASRRGPRSRRLLLLTVAALNAAAVRISHAGARQMS